MWHCDHGDHLAVHAVDEAVRELAEPQLAGMTLVQGSDCRLSHQHLAHLFEPALQSRRRTTPEGRFAPLQRGIEFTPRSGVDDDLH